MIVDILGTPYTIIEQTVDDNPKLVGNSGICEQFSKKIVVLPLSEYTNDPDSFECIENYYKKVMRHEIVHAFFAESGLLSNCPYASNEELVDWIAVQFPKLAKAFRDANAE